MAKLYIKEIKGFRNFADRSIPDLEQTFDQTPVTIGAGSLQSAAFGTSTIAIEIATDAICSIAYGTNPTASANTMRLAAGERRLYAVRPGNKIAVITNT